MIINSPPSPLPMSSPDDMGPDDNSEGDIVSRAEREDDEPPLKKKKGGNRGDIVWVQVG